MEDGGSVTAGNASSIRSLSRMHLLYNFVASLVLVLK